MRGRSKTVCGNYYNRHWFAYWGRVGSSSPVCVRCGTENPRYNPDRDDKPDPGYR